MSRFGFVILLGLAVLMLGVSAQGQPAQALGDLFRRGPCYPPHPPEVRHRTIREHVVKRPGVYVIKRRPGLYGYQKVPVRTPRGHVVWRQRRVLLRPYENVARYHKPRHHWAHKQQRIIAVAPPRPSGAWPDRC